MPVEVLLAHPSQATAARLAALLAAEDGLDVVGACADGTRALALAGRLPPDVLVTGLRLPGLDGVELTRRAAARGVRVVALVDGAPVPLALAVLGAGARGLVEHADGRELPRAVRLVAAGGALVSPRLTRPLIEACVHGAVTVVGPDLGRLTPREREVLSLVGTGLSTQEIADRLVVAEVTAKTHVRRTMVKLGARTRTQLVAIAWESGLLRGARRRREGVSAPS
ncbi:LuxR C-terminal-related transcriptional regulator [Streptomyces sp. NPDC090106]|uniref:LuxR C-terminal-related transcriptional regulator n=1 Tax=Streptomyces sp. NPDC090106 TaxID=3365946 RepID=UPI00381AF175